MKNLQKHEEQELKAVLFLLDSEWSISPDSNSGYPPSTILIDINIAFIRYCVYSNYYNHSGGCHGLYISKRSRSKI